jgi:uncharacterized caspase-like protein
MAAERRAVVIGVNNYDDPGIEKLQGAVYDAEHLRDRLVQYGDFEIDDDHFLTDKAATCLAIRKAISDLLWKLDSTSLSLFYFSGHGFQDEYGNGYLAPHDIDPKAPLVCGIRMQELTELLVAAQNKRAVIAILDCCYSGIATEGKATAPAPLAGGPRFDEWFSPLDVATLDRGDAQGRIILASSRKDEKSREKAQCVHALGNEGPHAHGAFTYHLLEGLDGKATDGSEAVTLDGLRKYIDREMEKNDPQHSMSLFGAAVSKADQILLTRASHWREIQEKLENAEQCCAAGDPNSVFTAIRLLGEVRLRCPKLERVTTLETLIDDRLTPYKTVVINWCLSKRMDPRVNSLESFRKVRELAAELNAATILAQSYTMGGLLLSLCEVASQQAYAKEDNFVAELRATSNLEPQAAVAKTAISGSKLN